MADDYFSYDPFAEAGQIPEPEVSWSDYGTALKSGAKGVQKSIAGAQQYVMEKVASSPEVMKDSIPEQERNLYGLEQKVIGNEFSEGARRIKSASLMPKEGQESAFNNLGSWIALNGVEALPSVVSSIIPAALLAPILGSAAAAYGAGAVGGIINGGDLYNNIVEAVESKDDAFLKQNAPAYAGYRTMMDERDARAMLRSDMAGFKPVLAAAFTMLTSKYGVEGLLAKKSAGEAVGGRLKSAAVGGVGEGSQEFGETLTNELLSGYSQQQAGIGDIEWRDALAKSVDAMAIGGVLGGATGIVTGGKGSVKPAPAPDTFQDTSQGNPPPPPAPVTPPTDIVSGVLTPKAQAVKDVGNKRKKRKLASGSGVQVTASPVGETEAAVLAPEQAEAAPVMNPAAVLAGLNEPVTPNVPPVRAPIMAAPGTSAKLAGLNTEPAAPAPAAVASDENPTTAETPDQYTAQFTELDNKQRRAVFVKKGVKVEAPAGLEAVEIKGRGYPPDTRGTYYFRSPVTPNEIMQLAKGNQTNKLFGMGSATKADALATGEEPVGLQKTNSEGVATVQQAVAPSQVQANAQEIMENAAPGDTIGVTDPEAVLKAREEGENAAPSTPLAVAPSTQIGPGGRRVMENLEAKKREAADIAARQAELDKVAANSEKRRQDKVAADETQFKEDEPRFKTRMSKLSKALGAKAPPEVKRALQLFNERKALGKGNSKQKTGITAQIRKLQQAELEQRPATPLPAEPTAATEVAVVEQPQQKKLGRPKSNPLAGTEQETPEQELARLIEDQKNEAYYDKIGRDDKALGDPLGDKSVGRADDSEAKEIGDERDEGGSIGGDERGNDRQEVLDAVSSSGMDASDTAAARKLSQEQEAEFEARVDKLKEKRGLIQALLDDPASKEGEKSNARAQLARIKRELEALQIERDVADDIVTQETEEERKARLDARRSEGYEPVTPPKAARVIEVANKRRPLGPKPTVTGKVTLKGKSEPKPEPKPEPEVVIAAPVDTAPTPQETPQWALNVAVRVGGHVVYVNEEQGVALVEGYMMGSGMPTYSGVLSNGAYTQIDISKFTGSGFTTEQKNLLLDERKRIIDADAAAYAANSDGPFKGGKQVVASPGVDPRLVTIAEKLLKLLNIKSRVFIGMPADMQIRGAVDRFGLYGPFASARSFTLTEEGGGVRRLSNGDYALVMAPRPRMSLYIETLAHEIGHILDKEAYQKADPATQAAIKKAFEQWRDANKGRKIPDIIKALRARSTGKATSVSASMQEATGDQMSSGNQAYWLGFSEWFADQTARWATSEEKPLTIVDEFFKKIADAYRSIVRALNGGKYVSDEMRKFLNNRVPTDFLDLATARADESGYQTGKPFVADVYHGTGGVFEKFSKAFLGKLTGAQSAKRAFFFSRGIDTATHYAGLSDVKDQEAKANRLNQILEDKYSGKQISAEDAAFVQAAIENVDQDGFDRRDNMKKYYDRAEAQFATTGSVDWEARTSVVRWAMFGLDWTPINIRLARIRMENPLVYDFQGKSYRETSYDDVIKLAQANGHDGVVMLNTFDGGPQDTIYAVFNEEQTSDRFNPDRAEGSYFPMKAGVDVNAVPVNDKDFVYPTESYPLEQILKGLNFENYGPLFPIIRDRVLREVKGVNIHVVSPVEMLVVSGSSSAMGHYDSTPARGAENVFVRSDLTYDQLAHTVVHEAVHALVMRAMGRDPRLMLAVSSVMNDALKHFIAKGYTKEQIGFSSYAFTNENEFIAETWGNQKFQALLAETPITPELAANLGIDQWRAKSLWTALLEVLNKALRLPNNAVSALEAIARITDVAASRRGAFNPAEAPISSSRLDTSEVTNAALDRGKAVASWSKRAWTKFRAFNQLEQDFRNTAIGPALTQIQQAVAAAGPKAEVIKKNGDLLAGRIIDAQLANPKGVAELAEIAETARMLDVNMEGTNVHLGKDDSAHWQAQRELPALQERFKVMPTELKQLYRDMTNFYRDTHNQIVKASVKGILQQLLLNNKLTEQQVNDLTSRVINQEMNDTDKALLGKTVFDNLKNASEFHAVKGDYFPLMRFGDHVVRTEDKIKDAMGGTLEGNDTVVFKNKSETVARKAAKAFTEKTDLRTIGRARKVYFDGNTGEEVTADEAKSLNDVVLGFRVKVQTQGVYFFESGREAEEFVRTNPEGHDVIRAPEMRKGSGYQPQILSGSQLGVMEKSVNARTDLSDGQRALIKSIINQSAARMVSGNRIASRRLKAQKVTGASRDISRALLQYNTAMSRHVTTAEAAPIIRDGLDKMDKALATYEGNDRPTLIAVSEEVKARVDQGIHEPNEASQVMKDVLTVSAIARLFSPMYTALQMTQPWMTTLPVLGGRFGNVRAASALSRAYSDIGLGDTALAGLMNTARATKQFNAAGLLGTDDIVGNMRKKFAGDADITAMLDRAIELNAINVNAGLEVSSAVADGRGRIGKIIAGTDRIARQLPQMAEAISRVTTAVSSYRLARESGMNQEKATQFAIDTVKNTQGDYSASNAPRFFNNPVLRPAMQFRKYAQMMTYLMVDLAKRTMDSDLTTEERKIAGKQLLNFMAVQIAMAGALSLPGLELVKAGFLIAAALGFGGGWDDQEEKLRKLVDQTVGRPIGQMITNGVFTRLGGYGIDVSQRMSLSDMWLFGEPRKNDSESQQAYLFRLMAGSSGSFILGVFDGVKDIGNGEIEKGLGKVLPIKFAADTAKAIGNMNRDREGDIGFGTVAVNAFGVKTAAQAEKSRDIGDRMRAKDKKTEQSKALIKAFYDARTPGEKVKAVARNKEFNKTLSKSEFRLNTPTNVDWKRPNER